jgi:nucleoid DNA-binding protein
MVQLRLGRARRFDDQREANAHGVCIGQAQARLVAERLESGLDGPAVGRPYGDVRSIANRTGRQGLGLTEQLLLHSAPQQQPTVHDMNKKEFIDAIAASHDALPRTEINRIVGTIIDTIGNEIKRGRTVQITGFGTFSTVRRKARKGRNPKTGEPIKIAAMTLPKFSAGKALKDRVSRKK